jgi:hypothetical protein
LKAKVVFSGDQGLQIPGEKQGWVVRAPSTLSESLEAVTNEIRDNPITIK